MKMNYTKDEVKEKILAVLQEAGKKMNPSAILSRLEWKKDKITEICKLFEVEKFTEILQQFSEVEIEKDNNGTTYVVFAQNKKAKENKNMAETEKTSENVHDRMKQLLAALNIGLYEKEEAVRLSLLTSVAGESMFLLDAPGCAKSMIARRIAKAFKTDGENPVRYFEYLMNQFSTPEDVFGNISIKALCGECEDNENMGGGNKKEGGNIKDNKEESDKNSHDGKEEYRRLTEGFLPTADIAFLDEIWKASPAILNSLLTIINERKFHNGSKVDDVPLKALFSASNELPAKNHGLEALYDRFILRLCVDFIENEESFFEMLEQPSSSEFEIPGELKQILISNDELKAWKTKIDSVSLSEEAKSVISAIRKELTARNENLDETAKNSGEAFEVGDRRWKKIARILKTSAFLNDRSEVDLMDCSLIEHCIWNTEAQQKKAREIVSKCIEENGLDCDTAIDDIEEQIEKFDKDITELFYKQDSKPKIYKMSDGHKAYKFVQSETIQSYDNITVDYICEDYEHHNWQGAYYDNNMKIIGNSNYYIENETFEIKEDEGKVSWIDGYSGQSYSAKIEMNNELIKDSKVFKTQGLLELLQNNADEKYDSIKNAIAIEIEKLNIFFKEQSEPFKENIFADQWYCDKIMATIKTAEKDLQDAQVDLDKKRTRYQNGGD